MMKTKFNIDWIKVNFIGIEPPSRAFATKARYFGDNDLIDRTVEVINDEALDIFGDIDITKRI
jgi:nitrogenase molybdenum-iron protein alpha chain